MTIYICCVVTCYSLISSIRVIDSSTVILLRPSDITYLKLYFYIRTLHFLYVHKEESLVVDM